MTLRCATVSLLLSLASCTCSVGSEPAAIADPEDWASIAITQQSWVYRGGQAELLRSQRELDRFVNRLRSTDAARWSSNDSLRAARSREVDRLRDELFAAEVDFRTEHLVVFFQTRGSGSIDVRLGTPLRRGDTIIFDVEEDRTELLTADMAYHAFALRVPVGRVLWVEVPRNSHRGDYVRLRASGRLIVTPPGP
ncbi:MAG: hypothetical protein AAF805_02315 [Planctomycetota bacterium]